MGFYQSLCKKIIDTPLHVSTKRPPASLARYSRVVYDKLEKEVLLCPVSGEAARKIPCNSHILLVIS